VIADRKLLRRLLVVFDVVVRTDDGRVDDPEARLAQLLIQLQLLPLGRVVDVGGA
jgi:hypothetical protein